MSVIVAELLLIAGLVFANGLFAMAEMAIVSSRRARLQRLAEAGDAGAQTALELAQSPDRFLSTVQIGITLVGILAGAFGGASIAEHIAEALQGVPAVAPYAEAIGLAAVVAGITYASLVFGELVPKRLALSRPEAIAARVARPMLRLAALTAPAVRLLSLSSAVVLKLLRVRPGQEPPVTDEEVRILLEQGTEAGVFDAAEQGMVDGVLRLDDRRISLLMTPRRDVVWLDADAPDTQTLRCLAEHPFARFPVCRGSVDNLVGVLQARAFLTARLNQATAPLVSHLEPPLFMPESTRALKALQLLRGSGRHLAVVIDEYGSLEGVVTLGDILEAIVGDVTQDVRDEDAAALRRDDGSWLLDGTLPVDELKDLLGVSDLPEDLRGRFQTLAGFVLTQFGRMPRAGEHFAWEGWRFEVVDTDGRRIDKILAAPLPPPPAPDSLS